MKNQKYNPYSVTMGDLVLGWLKQQKTELDSAFKEIHGSTIKTAVFYERLAAEMNYQDWNTLCAKIKAFTHEEAKVKLGVVLFPLGNACYKVFEKFALEAFGIEDDHIQYDHDTFMESEESWGEFEAQTALGSIGTKYANYTYWSCKAVNRYRLSQRFIQAIKSSGLDLDKLPLVLKQRFEDFMEGREWLLSPFTGPGSHREGWLCLGDDYCDDFFLYCFSKFTNSDSNFLIGFDEYIDQMDAHDFQKIEKAGFPRPSKFTFYKTAIKRSGR